MLFFETFDIPQHKCRITTHMLVRIVEKVQQRGNRLGPDGLQLPSSFGLLFRNTKIWTLCPTDLLNQAFDFGSANFEWQYQDSNRQCEDRFHAAAPLYGFFASGTP